MRSFVNELTFLSKSARRYSHRLGGLLWGPSKNRRSTRYIGFHARIVFTVVELNDQRHILAPRPPGNSGRSKGSTDSTFRHRVGRPGRAPFFLARPGNIVRGPTHQPPEVGWAAASGSSHGSVFLPSPGDNARPFRAAGPPMGVRHTTYQVIFVPFWPHKTQNLIFWGRRWRS